MTFVERTRNSFSELIQIPCEIFESAIYGDSGYRFSRSELRRKLQCGDNIHCGRRPRENASIFGYPPSHSACLWLINGARLIKIAVLKMWRTKPHPDALHAMWSAFAARGRRRT